MLKLMLHIVNVTKHTHNKDRESVRWQSSTLEIDEQWGC